MNESAKFRRSLLLRILSVSALLAGCNGGSEERCMDTLQNVDGAEECASADLAQYMLVESCDEELTIEGGPTQNGSECCYDVDVTSGNECHDMVDGRPLRIAGATVMAAPIDDRGWLEPMIAPDLGDLTPEQRKALADMWTRDLVPPVSTAVQCVMLLSHHADERTGETPSNPELPAFGGGTQNEEFGTSETVAAVVPSALRSVNLGPEPDDEQVGTAETVAAEIPSALLGVSLDEDPGETEDDVGTAAQFYHPAGIAIDPQRAAYALVVEEYNHRVRKIDLATRAVTTLARIGSGGSGPASHETLIGEATQR